ncbi:MAG: glutathione S-transferase N-terminal domain-containing protein [Alphaproteobacteria bacterium]|nr:glutathione S-transferase N-terminal domain-containing protein [Alphaproteobacteria bacterium]MDX5417421.1 glutathione S-transferase N-terminal domain-containing protein [Alphaproteobacteria bacterium]MDX5494894.1 glutathione S-transferase N-terminal domain-containing protein [Alphaproteobacteria bacterium]
MTLETPLLLSGAPGSPYTRKMLALLRYRHIPYRFFLSGHDTPKKLPAPKVQLLPTFYLKENGGDYQAAVDSSPLIRRFEKEFSGRSALPSDPVVDFIDYLIEDYADEWLTKAMFHYRWYYKPDIERAAAILPRWRAVTAAEDDHLKMGKFFAERQISRLYVVGSNDTTAPVIEASYLRFLDCMKAVLEKQPFVMGKRPGSSDFGIYGQLTQLTHFDPTPMDETLARAPRVFAWVDIVEDLSGVEPEDGDWIARDAISGVLGGLLKEIGRVYVPALIANAKALAAGAERVETEIDGKPWVQQPFPYQGKCLQWLREKREALSPADRAAVDTILAGSGCDALFAD